VQCLLADQHALCWSRCQGNLDSVQTVARSGLDVFAHNVETVPRLQSQVRDRRANWEQSMGVLEAAKAMGVQITKTSIMLGCGEAKEEVVAALAELRARGVDVVTLGQYMRPTKKHMAVSEFVTPEAFQYYESVAKEMGFLYVASGAMVRSSYRAGEFYLKNVLKAREAAKVAAEA
jgi:lipoyl synthase